jgi:bifunctional UDP-N-acetylglucosamine pyrophosphorylase/glucosamine-1-phosphate N-acetyltransferase
MVLHVVDALVELPLERTVLVVGHGADLVVKTLNDHLPDKSLSYVEQRVQRGTGDAVLVGLTAFTDDDVDDGDVIVLPGDTPLLRPHTLATLVRAHRQSDAAATLLTAVVGNPDGYGRVVRGKDGRVAAVVEDADATEEQREIDEVNTAIYCFRRSLLAPALRRLNPENVQGEYYLPDVIGVLYEAGHNVVSMVAADPMEAAGVNDRAQLAAAEAELRDRTNERWMLAGVTMVDPERTYVDVTVTIESDVTLFPGTMLRGATVVREGAQVGPETRLVDCEVGANAIVEQTVARRAEIGADARVGPFAYLGPGSQVATGMVTGPFFRSDVEGGEEV